MIVVPTYNMILSPDAALYLPLDMLRRSAEWREGAQAPVLLAPFDVISRKSTDFYRMDFHHQAKEKGKN